MLTMTWKQPGRCEYCVSQNHTVV